MRALRTAVVIALGIVLGRASAGAQTSPPPATQPPPAAQPQPPATQPPPAAQPQPPAAQPQPPAAQPPANQPPPPQPPPPGYQQPPPGYQQPPPGYQQPPPGYQQQPPPGYQQPPPGYQQPPPGYQQPPPGYQQPPPGYYQQPPPGYQQPPPGYQQQPPPGYYQQPPPGTYPPGYVPQAPPPQPSPPPRTYGFLALPYLGFSSHVGDSGAGLNTAGSIGVLLGGRLNSSFSINGELRADTLDFRDVPAGESWEGSEFDLAFSPLYHVQFPAGELVVGPKIGLGGMQERDTLNGVDNGTYDQSGITVGANAGVFFAVSRVVSLGAMFSFTVRDFSRDCYTPPGGTQGCRTTDLPAMNVFGFHAAALF